MTGTSVPARRARTAAALVIASGALALAGCGQSGGTAVPDPYSIGPQPTGRTVALDRQAGQWRVDGDTLAFTGRVSAGTAAAFAHAVGGGIQTVSVSSPGGDLAGALPVAAYIRAHHLAIVVTGPCAGPCADYWFPAATSRTVRLGGWLGFAPDLAMTGQHDTPAGRAESKLYAASGVHAAALHADLTDELRIAPGAAPGGPAQLWMPTAAELSALGVAGDAAGLPGNLAAANAHAETWGVVAAYEHTIVGVPAPKPTASPGVPATP